MSSRSGAQPHDEGTLHDDLSAMADIVRREVKREMGRLRSAAGDMVERGRETAERAREGLSERIRERPLTSVLIAGGLGLLRGARATRRRGE